MERARKGWVRGALVLGVAGAMMAVAMLSPAVGVSFATKSFVKQKVNQVKNQVNTVNGIALSAFRSPAYFQSAPLTLPGSSSGIAEASCGAAHAVSGGLSSSATGSTAIIETYPSDGDLSTLHVTGKNGWSVGVGNLSADPVTIYVYLVCAETSSSTGNVGGPSRSSDGAGKWAWTTDTFAPGTGFE